MVTLVRSILSSFFGCSPGDFDPQPILLQKNTEFFRFDSLFFFNREQNICVGFGLTCQKCLLKGGTRLGHEIGGGLLWLASTIFSTPRAPSTF